MAKEGGKKFDQEKLRPELYPVLAYEEICKVLTGGAIKYGDWNWAEGIKFSRLLGALKRHIAAFEKCDDVDPEFGALHLGHAGCCIAYLIHMYYCRPDMDDRRTPEEQGMKYAKEMMAETMNHLKELKDKKKK